MEDWAITEEIMPNLFKFCHSDSNIVYCPNIISQVRKGTSSDGQLIVETGLLPIDEGAVCFRFPQNTFPSLNDLFEGQKSTTLIPTPLSVWNQIKMSRCYKYDKDITCESNDKVALSLLSNLLGNYNSILAITVSTHSPFSSVSDSSSLDTHKGIPEIMSNYLRSLNYTDCFLGNFLDDYLENKEFENLKGMIYISLGKLVEARKIFTDIFYCWWLYSFIPGLGYFMASFCRVLANL